MDDVRRVLIVEDDRDVRDTTAEYLSSHGFEVETADDGKAMRAALGRRVPDVVLLDLRLPGEDGLSLARHLRQNHDVAIVMVTGAGDVVDRVVGLEVGADDYIAKPFDPRELLARVKSVLRRVRARPARRARGVSLPNADGRVVLPAGPGRERLDRPQDHLTWAIHQNAGFP